MKGIIVFLETFKGTKSESLQPFLYMGQGRTIRVYKKGDNPFENASFSCFDAKEVWLEGELNEDGVLEVETVSFDPCVTDDPTQLVSAGVDADQPDCASMENDTETAISANTDTMILESEDSL